MGRLVDLDHVPEAEDPLGERAVPDQVVERGEEHGRGRARRARRRGRRRAARRRPRPRDGASSPVLDERVEVRADPPRAAREAPVLDDRRVGEAARARARRARPASRRYVASSGIGASSASAREHPLRQVVEPLEVAAAGDREPAGAPERLEHPLRRLVVPHAPAALALELARAPSGRARGSRRGRARRAPGRRRSRRRTSGARAAPAMRRLKSGKSSIGHQARLVAPSTRTPGPRASSSETVPRGYVADARAEHDPVAPLDGRDRVELDARQRGGRPPRRRPRSRGAPGRRSPARRRRAPARPRAISVTLRARYSSRSARVSTPTGLPDVGDDDGRRRCPRDPWKTVSTDSLDLDRGKRGLHRRPRRRRSAPRGFANRRSSRPRSRTEPTTSASDVDRLVPHDRDLRDPVALHQLDRVRRPSRATRRRRVSGTSRSSRRA